MKWLRFAERFCDVFKWAHGIAFAWFAIVLIASIDCPDVPFLRVFGVLLYSGGMCGLMMILQELARVEIKQSEDAETACVLYNVFRDIMIDNERHL